MLKRGDNVMKNSEAFEILGLTPKTDKLTAEQIKAVKGLGCLQDKRFDDVFNVELNGKFDLIFIDAAKAQYIKFFNKFNLDIEKVFAIEKLLKNKLLEDKKGYIRIPEDKLYISNHILINFID